MNLSLILVGLYQRNNIIMGFHRTQNSNLRINALFFRF